MTGVGTKSFQSILSIHVRTINCGTEQYLYGFFLGGATCAYWRIGIACNTPESHGSWVLDQLIHLTFQTSYLVSGLAQFLHGHFQLHETERHWHEWEDGNRFAVFNTDSTTIKLDCNLQDQHFQYWDQYDLNILHIRRRLAMCVFRRTFKKKSPST